ncbi:MAG: FG-GAP repeat protein, partial [Blastocatellia bacterium]
MYSANFRGFAIRRILVLSLLTLAGLAATFYWQEVKSATTTAALPTLPTLRGEAALDHLKQQGIYASLSEAVTAARYSAQPLPSGRVFEFVNPDNNLRATFNAADRSGARVTASNNKQQRELAIKLAGYGYGQNIIALSPRGVDARQNRVEYTHLPESAIRNPQSAIKEWFVNTRDGIEHGFTLPAPPAVERKGEAALRIEMEIGGDFSVRLSAETQTVSLVDSAGAAELRYDKLRVYDANRRDVPAHFELNTLAPARGTDSNRLAIVVDDRAAAYPLTIDPLLAQGPRLTAGDGAAEDYFGAAVAISGNTAIVGAPRNDINGDADQGAAYIFVRSGGVWTQQDKLRAATGAAGDFFGGSVGIGGDTAIVGAYLNDVGANANQGTAYVFTRSAGVWTQQDKLTAGDGAANDFFGFSIAIDGDTAIVGAHLNDASANGNQGAAYVFTRGSGVWSQLQKLTAPDAAAGDLFGVSIALDAGTAVIGASGKVERGNADAGAAYAFTRSGGLWTMQQKLLPDISAVGNFFGAAVALSGDTALIGSFGDDIGANANQGSAVVFVRSAATWTKQQKLTASDGSPDDRFGLSVALSGDTAVVGATGKDFAGADQGAAYVFSRSGVAWAQRPRLFAIDGEADDKFGAPVAISGDTVLAGASFDDIGANANQGSAQVFVICQGLAEQQRLTANLGSAGDAFGYSVAISGDTAVIGALYNDLGGNADQGTAYVFVRNGATWTQQQKLTDANGVAYDYFGASVAIGGDTVVIGADGNAGLGAAFVFVRNGAVWTQQQKLTDANGAASDSFGRSVAISGDTVVIGAPYDDVGGNLDQGSVIVFVRNGATWTQQRKLTDSLGAAGDDFGRSVAIGGDTAVIGAYGNAGQGAAFVFVRNGAVWTQKQKLTDA